MAGAASQGSCTHDDGFNVFQKPPGKGGTIAFNWHISYGMGWDGSASGGETDNIICRAANCPRSRSQSHIAAAGEQEEREGTRNALIARPPVDGKQSHCTALT